ncbi:uncharacterized protein LOC132884997 isoform X2 [Neoarius graeffei]|uniref:uncharacterized protein LOC132884997 isoform X2 n=1 Tax=Neoarius graeffei TaxID=443677 RepID=UPI00298CB352|nr:uncharacterized protein LOC132884997 isoform X2 [Neoarius graeffei]
MDSTVLRVIFGHRIEKLSLPSIPETIEELNMAVKETFGIPKEFSLQYFEDFLMLHSTAAIKHKATIKVMKLEPVVINLYPVHNESDAESFSSSVSSDPYHSSSASSATMSPNSSLQRKQWPTEFTIPQFSVETEMVIEKANELYRKDSTLLTTPNIKSDILEKLAQSIYTYTPYPSLQNRLSVAEALIKAHPCLKDPGSSSGIIGWQNSIKIKMANYRTKLRGLDIPDVTCNALKHKHPADQKSAKNVKKAKRAEVNYLPPYPAGENEQTLEKVREELIIESKKKNNEKIVKDKMSTTFALRRHEIINQCPSVRDIKERWPALFDPSQMEESLILLWAKY